MSKRVLTTVICFLALVFVVLLFAYPGFGITLLWFIGSLFLVLLLGCLLLQKDIFDESEVSILSKKLELALTVSSRLSEKVKQLQTSSQEVSDTSKIVSKSADEVLQSVSQSKEVVENLTNSIEENFELVEQTAKTFSAVKQDAEKSGGYSENAKNVLGQITKSIKESEKLAEELESKTKQIGNIVEIITSVSEQTKLLALNASIEASRAGEAGEGFGVVAEEIRKLSEEAGNSVKKVSKLVNEIMGSVKVVVSSLVKSSHEAGVSSNVISEALEVTKRISGITTKTSNFVEDVYSMFEQQIAAIRVVRNSFVNIQTNSRENKDYMEQVSLGLKESSVLVEELGLNSRQLAELMSGIKEGLGDDKEE